MKTSTKVIHAPSPDGNIWCGLKRNDVVHVNAWAAITCIDCLESGFAHPTDNSHWFENIHKRIDELKGGQFDKDMVELLNE